MSTATVLSRPFASAVSVMWGFRPCCLVITYVVSPRRSASAASARALCAIVSRSTTHVFGGIRPL